MRARPVVWVLVHDLGRSGVPVALARMVAWQAASMPDAAEVHVVAVRDGAVRAEIEAAAASVTTADPPAGRSRPSALAAAAAQLDRPRAAAVVRARAWRHRLRHLPPPDVVLVHGAGGWLVHRDLVARLPRGVRTVVHLHELRTALDRSIPPAHQSTLLARADAVVAVCEPVAELARSVGAKAPVAVVPGVADEPDPARRRAGDRRRGRAVVSIGTPGWRKGTDRALAVAWELRRTQPDTSCTWIGGPADGQPPLRTEVPLPLTFTRATDRPWDDVPTGAVLLVPSREDPLPLVVLEAGARRVPVVAADTGGLAELVGSDRGLVVPGHDLAALAGAVGACLDDPDGAAERAHRLADHVAQHHTAEVVGPRWLAAILGHP